MLDIILNLLLVELASDETFLPPVNSRSTSAIRYTHDIEDCPVGVAGELVLGGVSNKAFLVGEGDP